MAIQVVYIDDELELCQLFQEILTSPEVNVMTYQDPAEGIRMINELQPDMIFLDFRLPKTTGDLVARQLLTKAPKFLITGELLPDYEFPFEKIFQKPIRYDELSDFIINYRAKASDAKAR